MFKYKLVRIDTMKGIKKAEWYKANGWKIIVNSFDNLLFEKEI